MSDIYTEESKNLDVIGHLEELRKRILVYLGAISILGVVLFVHGRILMDMVKAPLRGLVPELIFISPTESFVSYIKVILLSAFIFSFPVLLYLVWGFLAPAVPKNSRPRIMVWIAASLLLFIAGVFFSYFLLMPAALNFLLNFAKGVATARITLDRYVSFFTALILASGVIFQIPVGMTLMVDMGFMKARQFRQKRLHSLVAILIAAAVITPTQDIANMVLFAAPMAVLYEIGIIASDLIERAKTRIKDDINNRKGI